MSSTLAILDDDDDDGGDEEPMAPPNEEGNIGLPDLGVGGEEVARIGRLFDELMNDIEGGVPMEANAAINNQDAPQAADGEVQMEGNVAINNQDAPQAAAGEVQMEGNVAADILNVGEENQGNVAINNQGAPQAADGEVHIEENVAINNQGAPPQAADGEVENIQNHNGFDPNGDQQIDGNGAEQNADQQNDGNNINILELDGNNLDAGLVPDDPLPADDQLNALGDEQREDADILNEGEENPHENPDAGDMPWDDDDDDGKIQMFCNGFFLVLSNSSFLLTSCFR